MSAVLVAWSSGGIRSFAQQPAPPLLPIPPQPPAAAPSALLQNYPPVTAERLKHPADGEWLMVRRTYDGWGYSPLEEITPRNVKNLRPVWVLSTGMNNGQEAAPVVNGGVMFVSTSYNQVLAIDAKSGTVLWRFSSPPPGNMRGKPVSRGVALYGDKVFFALGEAMLIALDARTGKQVWRTPIGNNASGEYMTAAPLVADGSSSAFRVVTVRTAASWRPTIRRAAEKCGRPTRFLRPGSLETIRGAARNGKRVAAPRG
jgi:alcohol dehydrogenase (cytochrome c)